MDPEGFSNYSTNSAPVDLDKHAYYFQIGIYERLFLELYTLTSIVSLICCCILIFTIIKYEKLREQSTNIILLNITILHSIYLFTSPLLLRLLLEFSLIYKISYHAQCVLNQIESVLLLLIFVFVVLILCDSYLKLYHEQKYRKFTKIYHFIMVFFLFCALVSCGISIHLCASFFFSFYTIILLICVYLALLIVVIVMNIVHKVKSKRLLNAAPNIGLGIANISVVSWLPTLFAVLLAMSDISHPIGFILATVIGFTSPLSNLIYLYIVDTYFNIFLKRVITCKCRVYDHMQDQAVVFTETNGVQIT